jgi:hypothetical protein
MAVWRAKKMEYKDIWNDLCFHISQESSNASEHDFQLIAESLFEKLGWLQHKGEIIAQKTISVGSSNSVKPDIVIKKDGETLFVIRLKKPNSTMSGRNVEQLFSDMRLLKLNFGILIGETLQVYYESTNNNKPPVQICDISFDSDYEEGIGIIKLLSKNEYSFEEFKKHCEKILVGREECVTIQKYVRLLCSEKGAGIIMDLLKEKLSTDCSEDVAASIINKVNISISRKGENGGETPPGRTNDLTKVKAISLCGKNGISLKGEITFASKNKSAHNYWANPKITFLEHDWWFLLNDCIRHRLHVFYIPANSIRRNQVKTRSDNASKINFQIKYDDDSFEDGPSGIIFERWLVRTIPY